MQIIFLTSAVGAREAYHRGDAMDWPDDEDARRLATTETYYANTTKPRRELAASRKVQK